MLIASAAVRAYYVSFHGFHVVWTYVFLPSTILFFLIGHFSRWLADDILPYLHKPIAGTALLLTAIAALTLPTYAVWDSARFWIASVSIAMALPGIFALTKDHTTINFFGDLSFPVYIIHKIVFVALINLGVFSATQAIPLEDTTRAITLTLFAMVSATALALAVHQFIEKPTAVLMRRLMSYARYWKESEGKA